MTRKHKQNRHRRFLVGIQIFVQFHRTVFLAKCHGINHVKHLGNRYSRTNCIYFRHINQLTFTYVADAFFKFIAEHFHIRSHSLNQPLGTLCRNAFPCFFHVTGNPPFQHMFRLSCALGYAAIFINPLKKTVALINLALHKNDISGLRK